MFAKDGYQVWVGPDKDTDWIDVKGVYKFEPPPNDPEPMTAINVLVPVFEDLSPIQAIESLPGPGCNWRIEKANSVWELRSFTGAVEDYTLRLIAEKIDRGIVD